MGSGFGASPRKTHRPESTGPSYSGALTGTWMVRCEARAGFRGSKRTEVTTPSRRTGTASATLRRNV
jgi:hypothetical protein